jgi:hypothetical protein
MTSIGSSFATTHPPFGSSLPLPRLQIKSFRSSFRSSSEAKKPLGSPSPDRRRILQNHVGKLDSDHYFGATEMNTSPLTKVLLAVATLLALWSLVLCYMYIGRARQMRALQTDVNRLTAKQQVLTMMANDAVEYGKTHPAIEPLLQSLRTPKLAPTTNQAPTIPSRTPTR